EALRQFIVDENPANQDRLNVIQSVWAPRTENTVAGIRAVFEEAPVSFDYGTVQADLMYSGQ
ncbi:MAG: toluene monooxygenase, partial [Sulfobacillus sp.]|nr:toluene monooxygenase [Sulfobacillus sp.]